MGENEKVSSILLEDLTFFYPLSSTANLLISLQESYKMADLSSSLFKPTPLGLSPYSLAPLLVLGNQTLSYTHSNPPPKSKQIKHSHSE